MTITIKSIIESLSNELISSERRMYLDELSKYIHENRTQSKAINLNFICTHNSRRSQFSQVWAFVLGTYYSIPINSYSGGVEVTACNERTIASLKRMGFVIESKPNGTNPIYSLSFGTNTSINLFSKHYDDPVNPQNDFTAIMTCASADENCPFIPGAEKRFAIRFEDPKAFDNTELERSKYDERSLQIATELNYVFKKLVT